MKSTSETILGWYGIMYCFQERGGSIKTHLFGSKDVVLCMLVWEFVLLCFPCYFDKEKAEWPLCPIKSQNHGLTEKKKRYKIYQNLPFLLQQSKHNSTTINVHHTWGGCHDSSWLKLSHYDPFHLSMRAKSTTLIVSLRG